MTPPLDEIPNRASVLTEQRNEASRDLDKLSIDETLRLINDEDARVAVAVRAAIPALTPLIGVVVAAMKQGGRLIYFGAGTSGRLGVLDASECPPTFHTAPSMVVGIIAGGDGALRKSVEGAEDDPQGVRARWDELHIGVNDVVVGIAAGGTTPYVIGGLRLAKSHGAATGLIACAKASADAADHVIELLTGPEVVTGSTRMKAGTATKLALNMITTSAMVQLGKTWGNLMVDLRASNVKLIDRAVRIITSQCDVTREEAASLLRRADGSVKLALVMAKKNLDVTQAATLLDRHGGRLREILGGPR